MLLFRFPFVWAPSVPSVATAPAVVVAPVWAGVSPGATSWRKDDAQLLPRFERLYPEDSDLGWTKKESP